MMIRIAVAVLLILLFTGLILVLSRSDSAEEGDPSISNAAPPDTSSETGASSGSDPGGTIKTAPDRSGGEGTGSSAFPLVLTHSAQCETCHPEVYAEWKASWHAKAWTDPFVRAKDQSDNFKKKDCIPCHAPRPVFERGIRPGERVVERASNREDGVDCFSCHKLPRSGFAATRKVEGPCGPVYHPDLETVAVCAPCHNQHNTVDEWVASPERLKKSGCNDCHMPEKERPGRDGGSPKSGRDHTFPGGHDPEYLKTAFTLVHSLSSETGSPRLIVRLQNDACAHNLPADSRHRALDLILTYFDEGGVPLQALDGKRDYGQEAGTYRLRFRNPYRSEYGMKNTQIPAGEEAVLETEVPEGVDRARIEVIYKLTPFMRDDEGFNLRRIDLTIER